MKTLLWLAGGLGFGLAAYLILTAPENQPSGGVVGDAARDTFGWGTNKRVQGVGNNVVGKVKEGVGNLTGNDTLAGEGQGDQVVGTVKDAVGKVAQAAGKALHEINS